MKKKKIKKAKVNAPLTVKRIRNGKEVAERMYTNTPHGFKKTDGTLTQPLGTIIADNGKSILQKKENGKPARKSVIVLKDKEAYHEGKSMHLQGIGKVPATEAKNVKVGDVLMWNYGETETVTNIKPSKSGKTLVLDIKNDKGRKGSRRVNVDRLVSVDKHVEIKPNVSKQTQANTKAKPPKQTVADSKPKAKNVPPVSPPQSQEAQPKRRVYKTLPSNYSVVQGTVAQSDGTILIHNGKPLFKQNKDGKTEQAKDSHGKPAHKVAALIIDPKAFNQAKNAERKLVDVEIRKHNDAKGGHPHIVVDTVDGKNVSIGISHSKKKGKNHPNIPLQHNPLGGEEQVYMKRQGTVDVKENYSSTKKTGQLTETDNEKAKKIGEKAKQKELSKKK